jgi:uncharacterized lipoprotein YddW (UPF0748 family)
MNRLLLGLFLMLVAGVWPSSDTAPFVREEPPVVPREFRAAWVTPVSDMGLRDWPSTPGIAPDSQRSEMIALLDRAAAAGLNAVILHVRISADAMYPTRLAPWSAFLTGASGVGPVPAYDPLAFAVEQAHARGLQLHAWFNPFRAMSPLFAGKAARSHVSRAHPAWVRRYGSQLWMDPGLPEVRKNALDVMLDVVRRYDVDGVHVDDYFYPYRETRTVTRRVRGKRVRVRETLPFPDGASWKKYGQARGWTNRAAWRRNNIDDFVQSLFRGVRAIKPTVLIGVSPFGIWRSGSPAGVTGLDAFSEIYADSRRWLGEGWLDYLSPQLYWPLDGAQDRFRALDAWWRTQNPQGRHIWPGLYSSRIYSASKPWAAGEIPAQIDALRAGRQGTTDASGHVHFRLSALLADSSALARRLLSSEYADRAIVPDSPWIAGPPPAAPSVRLVQNDGPAEVTVIPGDSVSVRWWLVQARGTDGTWRTALRFAGASAKVLRAEAFGTDSPDRVAVTAISAAGRAGPVTIVAP